MIVVDGQRIALGSREFVAAGGQGRVFAQGDTAYKIFEQPSALIPAAKLDELRALRGPHVAAPQRDVEDLHGDRIGYTMPFFRGGTSWARVCTPAYRRRTGLDDRAAVALATSLAAALTEIHRHGVTVVDLSENNVLVRDTSVCLIDLDSWQTPTHPATALTPTIACPQATPGHFDAGTDWFAFAVLTATLLLGIHPFKGKHPSVKGLQARMQAGLSVFDAAVRIPAMCGDPRALPPTWYRWLRAVLQDAERSPPPLGSLPSPTPLCTRRGDTGPAFSYPEPVRGVIVAGPTTFVSTATMAFADDRLWHDDGRAIAACGMTGSQPYVLVRAGADALRLVVRGCPTERIVPRRLDDLLSVGGRVFARSAGCIVELEVRMLGSQPVLLTREVTRVLPLATQLFPGVAMHNVLGSWHASLLGHPRGAPQCALPELGAAAVLDARRDGDRLVVLAQAGATPTRHIWHLGHLGAPLTHESTPDASPWSTLFASADGMYAEVGQDGVVWCDGPSGLGVTTIALAAGAVDLHSDGHRVVASSGCEVWRVPSPRVQQQTSLGFDAMRCR